MSLCGGNYWASGNNRRRFALGNESTEQYVSSGQVPIVMPLSVNFANIIPAADICCCRDGCNCDVKAALLSASYVHSTLTLFISTLTCVCKCRPTYIYIYMSKLSIHQCML